MKFVSQSVDVRRYFFDLILQILTRSAEWLLVYYLLSELTQFHRQQRYLLPKIVMYLPGKTASLIFLGSDRSDRCIPECRFVLAGSYKQITIWLVV